MYPIYNGTLPNTFHGPIMLYSPFSGFKSVSFWQFPPSFCYWNSASDSYKEYLEEKKIPSLKIDFWFLLDHTKHIGVPGYPCESNMRHNKWRIARDYNDSLFKPKHFLMFSLPFHLLTPNVYLEKKPFFYSPDSLDIFQLYRVDQWG